MSIRNTAITTKYQDQPAPIEHITAIDYVASGDRLVVGEVDPGSSNDRVYLRIQNGDKAYNGNFHVIQLTKDELNVLAEKLKQLAKQ